MWITPSRLWLDNKSWMNREVHVQFCESVGVKLPCATRPYVKIKRSGSLGAFRITACGIWRGWSPGAERF